MRNRSKLQRAGDYSQTADLNNKLVAILVYPQPQRADPLLGDPEMG